jgi:transcription initiation factor TFIIF subunit alpha
MQFSDNVDFTSWKSVKMERENNLKEYKGIEEDTPKFGAGSEYNRDLKEEAKRKRAGIIARRYQPDAQPWILKSGGKTGKKFRGQREGGVSQNASFYVFTHAPDGAIEAYPLNEWYNFKSINRYKTLSAEEAEAEFSHRKKVLNYFSLMLRKRLKGDEEETVDKEEGLAVKSAKTSKKDLKISDMDEDAWMDSDDLSSSDEDKEKEKKEESDEDSKKKKQVKKKPFEKKKKRDSDDEAFEESDDGDEEGRELDYISDSSDRSVKINFKFLSKIFFYF